MVIWYVCVTVVWTMEERGGFQKDCKNVCFNTNTQILTYKLCTDVIWIILKKTKQKKNKKNTFFLN